MYRHDLSVAGVSLRLESDCPIEVGENFRPFLTPCGNPDVSAAFSCVDALPAMPEMLLHEDSISRTCADENGNRVRFFYPSPGAEMPYGAVTREGDRTLRVQYLAREMARFSGLYNCFQHLDLESILMERDRMFLHASCVRTDFGGLLFSGRSGIGKSTQAELWCRLRQARLINGDRPILEKGERSWRAWGAPYAGSSQCYLNESCPVTAIVMLRQDNCCALRRMTAPEAFRAVWSGATVRSWDRVFVERASGLILELIDAVPVFEFGCTPDGEAVEYLEQALGKELGL